MSDIEGKLLLAIHEKGDVKDSGEWASSAQYDHQALVGVIKSLMASELIVVEVRSPPRKTISLGSHLATMHRTSTIPDTFLLMRR